MPCIGAAMTVHEALYLAHSRPNSLLSLLLLGKIYFETLHALAQCFGFWLFGCFRSKKQSK